mgnify:CR=1 FL=1
MEARHFAEAGAVEGAAFHILEPYGRNGSAIKVFPVTADFSGKEKCPFAAYDIFVHEEGTYETWFYMSATTPVVYESRQDIGYSVNDGKMQVVNTVKEPDKPFYTLEWKGRALQCRGSHNCNMTPEVKAFVNIFQEKMAEYEKEPKKQRKAG